MARITQIKIKDVVYTLGKASGFTLTINIVNNSGIVYLEDIVYEINNDGTDVSFRDVTGTSLVLNNVMSITFKDNYGGFIPDPNSGVSIGSTSGGDEYGSIALASGDSITIDLTQDTTIYIQDDSVGNAPPII